MTIKQVEQMIENDPRLKEYAEWLKDQFGEERVNRFKNKLKEI